MIIYKITNLINNKIYIGQTITTLDNRWKRHTWNCTTNNSHMAITDAIAKYGKNNFKIEQIDIADTIDELNNKEQYWISFSKSMSPNGYNLTSGGNNFIMSDETKKKISISNKNKIISPEAKLKSSISHTGYKQSDETKHKLSLHFKGKPTSQNTRVGASIKNAKKCILTSPNGEDIEIINIKKFATKNDLQASNLSKLINNKINQYKGWKLKQVIGFIRDIQ